MSKRDSRLVPLAAVAWAGAWGGTSGWWPSHSVLIALIGIGAVVVALLWKLQHLWAAATVLVLLATLVLAGWRSAERHDSPLSELAHRKAHVTAQVRFSAEPRLADRSVVVAAELSWARTHEHHVSARVPVMIFASGEVGERLLTIRPGDGYQVQAVLSPAKATQPEAVLLSLQELAERNQSPSLLRRAVNAMRQGLRDALARSPAPQAALVPSLVVGDTSAVDDDMREQFRVTGLAHLMAVSGSNLVLLLGALLAFARGIGIRGRAVRCVAALGVLGFVALCGDEPSVVRAAAMGLVSLSATGIARTGRGLRALSLVIMVLMWLNPWMARSIGFALSAAACAGIVVLAPRLIDSLIGWAPRWLAEALAVPLAAQLATQPIITALSSHVSIVGVAANMLASPFVGPTTVLGLAAAALCWIPPLALVVGWVAGWLSQPILWIAAITAALPTPTWSWPATPVGIALISVAVIVLAATMPVVLKHPLLVGVLFSSILMVGQIRALPLGWPGPWQALVCDVGQGDATLVRADDNSAVLIDAAPSAEPVFDCLAAAGIDDIPLVVLTHYHADHIGGAEEVISRYRPQLILTRRGEIPAWLNTAAAQAGAQIHAAKAGEILAIGAARWTTVSVGSPPKTARLEEQEGAAENDASVVGIAEVEGLRILLPGDIELAGQAAALRSARKHGISLGVHVLKLPHHGSARQDALLFKATRATVAIASSGAGNDYGHPASATLNLAESLSMTIARTDTQGGIALSSTGDGVLVRHQRSDFE